MLENYGNTPLWQRVYLKIMCFLIMPLLLDKSIYEVCFADINEKTSWLIKRKLSE